MKNKMDAEFLNEENRYEGSFDYVLLSGGQKLYVHASDTCQGNVCPIHNPSDHSMRIMRQHFRYDRGLMERVCVHGVGHPDPDDIKITKGTDSGVHGCDGCCIYATKGK